MSEHQKNIVMRAIGFKDYELESMLSKIESSWYEGKLTDSEKEELIRHARENADPKASFDTIKRIEAIEERLKKLESGGQTGTEEWPPFLENTVYVSGDKVTFNGRRYICNLPEHTDRTTWSPAVYPAYWTAAK